MQVNAQPCACMRSGTTCVHLNAHAHAERVHARTRLDALVVLCEFVEQATLNIVNKLTALIRALLSSILVGHGSQALSQAPLATHDGHALSSTLQTRTARCRSRCPVADLSLCIIYAALNRRINTCNCNLQHAQVEKNTLISISGADKAIIGDFASTVRRQREPEPYKGKGIRYEGEVIKLKEGKAGGKKK